MLTIQMIDSPRLFIVLDPLVVKVGEFGLSKTSSRLTHSS